MASKWRVNEEGHIYYINTDLLSYVRDIDIRNIDVWILKGEVKHMTRQELMNECDSLQGNINRMMVTDDKEELYEMYCWAKARLETIYRENSKRIEDKE